jgi:thiamine biosynthesis lipoprotein
MPRFTAQVVSGKGSSPARRFAGEAMATTFRILVVEDDPVYARQAAAAAFEELALLERLLSRYVQSSDVSRINRLSAGQSTVVAAETFDCLHAAQRARRMTSGAFDVSYGSERAGRAEAFRLERDRRTVEILDRGVRIDLGGIGKGFALDRMAGLLHEWDISAAMLWASTSTVAAFGKPQAEQDWTVDFGPPGDRRRRTLRGAAFSGSGTAIQGGHIVDPRTGRPLQNGRRAWAAAPTAAIADALSTAFLVMPREEVRGCCARDPRIAAYLVDAGEDSLVAFE